MEQRPRHEVPRRVGELTHPTTDWRVIAYGVSLGSLAAYQQFKLPPVLPTLLGLYDYDRRIAGACMSIYALAGLALSLPLGRRIERHGAASYIHAALFLLLAGDALMLAWPSNDAIVLAARGLEGVAFAVCAIAGPALANMSASPRHLGIVFGLTALWIPAGQLLATFLTPVALALGGWEGLWIVAIVATLAMAVWTRSMARRRALAWPAAARIESRGPGDARKGQRLSLLTAATIFTLWSGQYFGYMTWLPQYLVETYRVTTAGAAAGYALPVAVLLVFNLLTGMALRAGWPLGHLLVAALASQAAVWWLIPSVGGAVGGTISLIVYGIGAGVTPTCLFALPSRIAGAGRAAGAFGVMMTGRNLGVLLGPVALAELTRRFGGWNGAVPAFGATSTAAVLLAIYLAIRLTADAPTHEPQGTRR